MSVRLSRGKCSERTEKEKASAPLPSKALGSLARVRLGNAGQRLCPQCRCERVGCVRLPYLVAPSRPRSLSLRAAPSLHLQCTAATALQSGVSVAQSVRFARARRTKKIRWRENVITLIKEDSVLPSFRAPGGRNRGWSRILVCIFHPHGRHFGRHFGRPRKFPLFPSAISQSANRV